MRIAIVAASITTATDTALRHHRWRREQGTCPRKYQPPPGAGATRYWRIGQIGRNATVKKRVVM